MKKLRKGDPVIVIAGKLKWSVSSIESVDGDMVTVKDVNVVKKAVKWQGFVKKTLPLHISNVAYYLADEKKPTKIAVEVKKDWKKVRKAKSYVIYKYDSEEGEYKKVAVRNGNSSNYYNIMNADDGAVYKYRIAAMSKRKGKGKKVCRISYPVWAVSESHTKGNIAKITTNKKSLKGKRGKIAKLRASVKTNNGKPSLSSKIRWYSSNTKVAKVNMKTGKVKFKKKGKCYIWAKAHNGKNSQKINVTVN